MLWILMISSRPESDPCCRSNLAVSVDESPHAASTSWSSLAQNISRGWGALGNTDPKLFPPISILSPPPARNSHQQALLRIVTNCAAASIYRELATGTTRLFPVRNRPPHATNSAVLSILRASHLDYFSLLFFVATHGSDITSPPTHSPPQTCLTRIQSRQLWQPLHPPRRLPAMPLP